MSSRVGRGVDLVADLRAVDVRVHVPVRGAGWGSVGAAERGMKVVAGFGLVSLGLASVWPLMTRR